MVSKTEARRRRRRTFRRLACIVAAIMTTAAVCAVGAAQDARSQEPYRFVPGLDSRSDEREEILARTYDLKNLIDTVRRRRNDSYAEAKAIVESLVLGATTWRPTQWPLAATVSWRTSNAYQSLLPLAYRNPSLVDQERPQSVFMPSEATWFGTELVVWQTRRGHEQIERQLDHLRNSSFEQINVFVEFKVCESKALEELEWVYVGSGGRYEDDAFERLSARSGTQSEPSGFIRREVRQSIETRQPGMLAVANRSWIKRHLDSHARYGGARGPKLEILDGQWAWCEDLEFVGIGTGDDGSRASDVVPVGTTIRLRASNAPGDRIGLDIDLTMIQLDDATTSQPSKRSDEGPSTPPEINTFRLLASVELQSGEAVLARLYEPEPAQLTRGQTLWKGIRRVARFDFSATKRTEIDLIPVIQAIRVVPSDER
jgi:hypothetical protein